ncbi:MAG TPA: pyridoxamine 5'-phosphate oxidase family protein [Bellilinea sp.]|nr:pyridoxamine 5'-phosphate oxidase family protein [Bellilinea sp.]
MEKDPATPISPPERPSMPAEYGISSGSQGLLSWEYVRQQMVKSHNYWINSTRPDGRPHAMPVWGVWLDDTLYFGIARTSRKALNLFANPTVSAHTESGDEVVILEGVVVEVAERSLLDRITREIAKKYPGMPPEADPDPGNVTFAVRASAVFAFHEQDFPKSATRWRF